MPPPSLVALSAPMQPGAAPAHGRAPWCFRLRAWECNTRRRARRNPQSNRSCAGMVAACSATGVWMEQACRCSSRSEAVGGQALRQAHHPGQSSRQLDGSLLRPQVIDNPDMAGAEGPVDTSPAGVDEP